MRLLATYSAKAAGWMMLTRKSASSPSKSRPLSVCNDRTDNEKAAIIAAGMPEDQIFAVPYTGESLSAQDAAGPVITANPDITNWIVFGCNDEGVLGTINALSTAGVAPDDIIAVGLGAYEACKFWAADQPSGFKAGLFISGLDVGATAAQVLHDAVVNGVEPAPATYAPTSIVNAENYTDVMDPITLANCGVSDEAMPEESSDVPEDLLFVAINKSADQQYFIDLQNAFIETANANGAEALKYDAKLDPSLGVTLIDDAISAGAQGIAITVPDQTIGPRDCPSRSRCWRGPYRHRMTPSVDENGDPRTFRWL